MHEEMRSAKMIEQNGLSVIKKEKYSPSPSRFQIFEYALDESTCQLYARKNYNTPNTRTEDENDKAQYLSTTITIVEIKTNQNESTYQMQSLKNTSLTSEYIYLIHEK